MVFGATATQAEVLWSIGAEAQDTNSPSNANMTTVLAENVTGSDGDAVFTDANGLHQSAFDVNGAGDTDGDSIDDTFYLRLRQKVKSTRLNYGSDYVEFTILAEDGFKLNLNSLSFDAVRGGAGGVRGYQVFGAANGTPSQSDLLYRVMDIDAGVRRNTPETNSIPLDDSKFQGIDTITLRIYPLSSPDGGSVEFANIKVNGTVEAKHVARIPELSCAGIVTGLFAFGLVCQRRPRVL